MMKCYIPRYLLVVAIYRQLCDTLIDGGVISQDKEVEKVFKNNDETMPFAPTAGGAVYVRWGRQTCPDTSELIYGGAVGGSYYTSSGGGLNYLCLPMVPIYGTVTPGADKLSRLYGAEYENPTGFTLGNAQSTTLQDENVPCAVCQSLNGDHYIMIPARDKCYPGWTQEYDGFLVSGANVHAGRTEFVCMDGSPETMTSGFPAENGALFYNVAGTCGSLPCPPYVENYELTCVVCTK